MPAEAPAPAPDEPAPLNDPPTESPRRIEHVKVLQARLSLLGFEPGPADGRYGPLTTDAVIRFQKAHDLPVDGVLGPLAEEALGVMLLPPTGERCQRVKALQRQLAWLGLEPGPVDGRYGPLTTAAVTRLQAAHDLRVDGIVGRLTAEALATSASARAISDRIERVKALQRKSAGSDSTPGRSTGAMGRRQPMRSSAFSKLTTWTPTASLTGRLVTPSTSASSNTCKISPSARTRTRGAEDRPHRGGEHGPEALRWGPAGARRTPTRWRGCLRWADGHG
jgi:peptidoglycan hydrolase-like protein with peptidoglycan-binding domain